MTGRDKGPQSELGALLFEIKGSRPWRQVAKELLGSEDPSPLHLANRKGWLTRERAELLSQRSGRDFRRFVRPPATARVAELEAERDRLQASLSELEERIASLEASDARQEAALERLVGLVERARDGGHAIQEL
jgi:hypothetical protein